MHGVLVGITWQDENFVTGGQQLSVFVPGEHGRRNGVGLAVQRDRVVDDHVSKVSAEARQGRGVGVFARLVENRWD